MGSAAAARAPSGGWQPLRVLGAAGGTAGVLGPDVGPGGVGAAPGPGLSLALPSAEAGPSTLYAPRGVLLDAVPGGTRVIAADTGNHRLLVWPALPSGDGAPSAVVVGQPDLRTEGPQAGGRGPERGLHLPTGLARAGDLLLVADAWNHRVLGFEAALDRDDPAPVLVLGQDGLAEVAPNRGGEPDGAGLYWPFGLLWHDGWLWVADTGNRRVLGWRGLPGPARQADVVLGQPSASARAENRGGDVAADSFRWPHQLAVLDGVLWVADAGNHRLLGWRLPVDADRPADHLLGQARATTAFELPHVPQGPGRLRFPYAVAATGDTLIVADTANNRVLGWPSPITADLPGEAGGTADGEAGGTADGAVPVTAGGPAAALVLGQSGFAAAGENRWTAVGRDSLCWPYGLSVAASEHGQLLGVADSGNNRIVVWHRPWA